MILDILKKMIGFILDLVQILQRLILLNLVELKKEKLVDFNYDSDK